MEDEKILELYLARNELAITESDGKYGKYLHFIAYQLLNNQEDTAECINDTYLRAWNSIPPTRPGCLRIFLGTITRNLSFDRVRTLQMKKRVPKELTVLLDELVECIPGTVSVEEQWENRQIANVISQFLKELPKEKRQLFIRRYWYCVSIGQLAAMGNYSESKIKSSLFEIRKKLKMYLEKEGITL